MKTQRNLTAVLALLFTLGSAVLETRGQGTAFTYQGRMNNNSLPASGSYDMAFTLYTMNVGGSAIAGPVTNAAVNVTNGLFTTTVDLGSNVFKGASNWLQIAVGTNGANSFTTLTPRQQLTPVPYAIFASAASNLSGMIPLAQLPGAVVTNNESNLTLTGTFSGNGAGLGGVNASTLNGLAATSFWQVGGNTVAGGQFIGSVNNRPVEIWANNGRALRLEPGGIGEGAPNVIGGSPGNFVAGGVVGAVVGGGATNYSVSLFNYYGNVFTNSVTGDFGTVGGGFANNAGGGGFQAATVAGGAANSAGSGYATVGGGEGNTASWLYATVAGGYQNSASGSFYGSSTVAGGRGNQASQDYSTVGGGSYNQATGYNATVPGGSGNLAGGSGSLAAGSGAQALHQGAFVWADSQGSFASTKNDSFNVRAQGGARFVTSGAGITVDGKPVFSGLNGNALTNLNLQLGNVDAAGAIAWGNFVQAPSPTLNVFPIIVVAADVNGDGALDLVGADNNEPGTLTVLTNNGFGVFGSNATLNAGNSPVSVVAADVNGDGKVDIISANYGASTLIVFTNNGFGVFGSNATLNVGLGPYCVTVADVNGDGMVDLICANAGVNWLTVFTNNGTGVFGLSATLPVGANPHFVVAADLNGDGKVDLISGNYSSYGGLTIWTNNGFGGFASNTTVNVGAYVDCLAVVDVNGDGKMDLVSSGAGNQIQVWTNNGSGVFGFNANLTVAGPPDFVAAADLNGDGKVDLVTANYSSAGSLTVLTNNGYGVFGSNMTLNAGSYPTCVVAADVNGDGRPDLIGVNYGAGTLSFYYSKPTFNGNFAGNGSGLTNLNAVDLTGILPLSGLPGFQSSSNYSAVSGGQNNTIFLNSDHSVIGGGWNNTISSNDYEGTIAGGYYNAISDIYNNGAYGNVGGGYNNTNSSYAGTVAGGQNNLASGQYQSTVGGGFNNTASGSYATVPGGFQNVASGAQSLAAGSHAQAVNQGAFVWADSQSGTFASTANDQFLVRAQGGVGINMNNPGGASLYVQGNRTNGWPNSVGFFENTSTVSNNAPALRVTVDGGNPLDGALSVSANISSSTRGIIAEFGNSSSFVVVITNDGTIYSKGVALTSDRNMKANFTKLDAQNVLAKVAAMPVTEWNYKEDSKNQRHIGPMAQDFHAAFGLNGGDDKHISIVDEGGVALAAIQGLNEKVEGRSQEEEGQIEDLRTENAQLKAELAELKSMVKRLAQGQQR